MPEPRLDHETRIPPPKRLRGSFEDATWPVREAAWKVEERFADTGSLYATWWLTEDSPYMVLAEVIQTDGQVRRITGVALEEDGDTRRYPAKYGRGDTNH